MDLLLWKLKRWGRVCELFLKKLDHFVFCIGNTESYIDELYYVQVVKGPDVDADPPPMDSTHL